MIRLYPYYSYHVLVVSDRHLDKTSAAMALNRVFNLPHLLHSFRSRPKCAQMSLLAQSFSPSFTRLQTCFPPILSISVPSLLAEVWESMLRAVPKKKTSYQKKRSRFLAGGKGLKDITSLNKCSACGNIKRAHLLCPFCVGGRCSRVACLLRVGAD